MNSMIVFPRCEKIRVHWRRLEVNRLASFLLAWLLWLLSRYRNDVFSREYELDCAEN